MEEKDINLKGRDYVTYEDFGAVGDGVTDDFGAIYETHKYANEHRLTVKGTPGKTYYIFDTRLGTESPFIVEIKTNVDWCGANFIIDDRKISVMRGTPYKEMAHKNIFWVLPDEEHKVFRLDDREKLDRIARQGLDMNTKKIDLGLDWAGPVMIIPYNSAHKVFRRRGYSQFAGEPMHEIIVVEADGSISEETPIMFSYASIDYIDVYKLDPSTAITIENGVFTTLESKINHFLPNEQGELAYTYHGYIGRGLNVQRSYTTVKNIEHKIEIGFGLRERAENNVEGAIYFGFFRASYANHVTFKDCLMPGRIAYGPANGYSSYNFGALCVNKIVLENCVQPNFWVTVDPETFEMKDAAIYDESATGHARKATLDCVVGTGSVNVNGVTRRMQWGIGGTNYCKNMEYINSTLSRFDAHAGLYHGRIINCNVSGLELTGVGEFILKDSAWYPYYNSTPLLYLRSDYGYHWGGDILIKNVKAYMIDGADLYLANHAFSNWYFGYTCRFPDITIDNLTFYNSKSEERLPAGHKAHIFKFKPFSSRMHLDDANIKSVFACIDEDGDGYIDEPKFLCESDGSFYPARDLDGDGKVGNTSLKYAEYFGVGNYKHGIIHPTCTVNLNKTRPPQYFKILNNTDSEGRCVCHYQFKNTADDGISDGGWYRAENEPDTMGGFFGGTKFVYGEGENDFFVGPDKNQEKTESFVFVDEYYS